MTVPGILVLQISTNSEQLHYTTNLDSLEVQLHYELIHSIVIF